jgi:hypothetical protein
LITPPRLFHWFSSLFMVFVSCVWHTRIFFSNRLLVESVFFLSRHQPPPFNFFFSCW